MECKGTPKCSLESGTVILNHYIILHRHVVPWLSVITATACVKPGNMRMGLYTYSSTMYTVCMTGGASGSGASIGRDVLSGSVQRYTCCHDLHVYLSHARRPDIDTDHALALASTQCRRMGSVQSCSVCSLPTSLRIPAPSMPLNKTVCESMGGLRFT